MRNAAVTGWPAVAVIVIVALGIVDAIERLVEAIL